MANWRFSLNAEGKELRSVIHEADTVEGSIQTLNCILKCLEMIKLHVSEDEYSWYFEDMEAACKEYTDEFQEELNSDFSDTDEDAFYLYTEDCINEILGDFYNGCDALRIWVGL